MSTRSKYYPMLKSLLKRPAFTIAEAENVGVPRHALVYLNKLGLIERVAKGIYRDPNFESQAGLILEELALSAYTVPNAVICLISALDYYGLTDQIPREHWLAIPHVQRASVRPLIRFVRMRNLSLGRITLHIGKYKVAIFDKERCIVDAFRYLSKEIAIKALQTYLKDSGSKPNLKKLNEYSQRLKVNLTHYILSFTT